MPSTPPAQAVSARALLRLDLAQRTPLRRIWRYVGYDEPNYTWSILDPIVSTDAGLELSLMRPVHSVCLVQCMPL